MHDRQGFARFQSHLAALGCSPAEVAALALLAAGGLAALGLLWWLGRPADGGAPLDPPAPTVVAEQVVVHVAGRVEAPGLYRLPPGARVADALAAAGGAQPDAVLDGLNLARVLGDGEQLVVPDQSTVQAGSPGGLAGSGAWRPDGTLDLNLATADDLQELPGVGPVLAQRILDFRESIGRFESVAQLRDVTGIGERRFAELSALVSV